MADQISIDVSGARQVGIRFEQFPQNVYDRLVAAVQEKTDELLARVEAATPTLTGRLRSQERARVFHDNPNRIAGYIDIAGEKGSGDFAKAAALEYGAHRATKVKPHPMKLDHYWSDRLTAPTMVMVGAYTRTPNIAAHSFMRGPAEQMKVEILAALHGAVDTAEVEANA
jgi:hypothetical protein